MTDADVVYLHEYFYYKYRRRIGQDDVVRTHNYRPSKQALSTKLGSITEMYNVILELPDGERVDGSYTKYSTSAGIRKVITPRMPLDIHDYVQIKMNSIKPSQAQGTHTEVDARLPERRQGSLSSTSEDVV